VLLTDLTGSWLFWAVACWLAGVGSAGAAYFAAWALRATEAADGMVVGLEDTTNSDGLPCTLPS
jgi:hypothetical protein